ncbi:RNA polymerase II subunit A C-terminal domain phosphatase-like isoform X3 [Macrobrachium nipponense]|uniref:RNA polymerase II subunit A C-terminal domain phosphatase-like isoform X3 n=1 Tax=Macrobrachium nipponense TaxID=159736 RepID=UPI0030C8B815
MLAVRECFTTNDTGQSYKVVSLFAKKGTNIMKKKKLCEVEAENGERIIVKAKNSGVVSQVLVKVNDVVEDGSCIMEITACVHPALMGNICCDCGMVLDDNEIPKSDTVSMIHSVPDLKIAKEEAEELGKKDQKNLLNQRKLVLLVDLDQTLIHTTNDNIPPELKDVYHFQLHSGGPWYHTRLRPHTKEFLEKISRLYELHICTFGVREYAHYIAHFLDPDGKLFGQRILSRNECIDPMSKKANLNSLFPCGDNMVCIIDDRTDVWNFSPNVIQVVPYHFFRHTGDINAPQGLQKKENDDRQGIDFKSFGKGLDSPEGSDEDFDKRTYSSDSDSDKDSKDKQEIEGDSAESDKISDDSAVDVHTDDAEMRDEDGKSSAQDIFDFKLQNITIEEKENSANKKNLKRQSQDNGKQRRKATKEDSKQKDNSSDSKQKDNSSETHEDESISESDSCKEKSDGTNFDTNEKVNKCSSETDVTESGKDSNPQTENQNLEREKTKELSCEESRPDNLIDVVDDDDFLLYLEDILGKIHVTFFNEYEKCKTQQQSDVKETELPDLKKLIPLVRKDVLKGINIVFSGVVPQQVKLKDSRAYQIAVCFGANVSERLIVRAKGESEKSDKGENRCYTTHLVAANINTEKVHRARRCKSIKIVTPNWLWSCVERWELVEERLFPLTKEVEKDVQRHPPHHCYCPDFSYQPTQIEAVPGPSGRTRTPSGNLLDDVNPLLFFSPDDKNSMAVEVDMMLSDDDESNFTDDNSEDEESGPERKKHRRMERNLDSTSSSSSERQTDEDGDSKLPSKVFHQGSGLPSDDSDGGLSDEDDLSRMGADLESLLD